MAVTWIDSAGSTLGSTVDAIDFSTDEDVIAISVSLGSGRAEERAYRDGAFVYPYLRSTQVGNTFALVREGGWPERASVQVFVDEEEPVLTTLWTERYDVDFTAQTTQTILATSISSPRTATPTIDGLIWDCKLVTNTGAQSTSCVLTNGTGLVLTGAPGGGASAGTMTGNWFALPLVNIPDYNAAMQTAMLMRVTAPALSVLGDTLFAASFDESQVYSARMFGKYSPANGGTAARWAHSFGDATPTAVDGQLSGAIDHVIGIIRTSNAEAFGVMLPWSGTFPTIEECYGAAYITRAATVTAPNKIGLHCTAGPGHTLAGTIKRMKIFQK